MAAPARPAAPAAAATSPAATPPPMTPSAPTPVESGPDNMVSAIVAPGRSIVTNDGLQLAGATVALDRDEALKLTALGYLVDPDAPLAKEANGPTFERRGS